MSTFKGFLEEAADKKEAFQAQTHDEAQKTHAEIHKHLTDAGFTHSKHEGKTAKHGPTEIHSYSRGKDTRSFTISIAKHPKTGHTTIVHHSDSSQYKYGDSRDNRDDREEKLESHTKEAHSAIAKSAVAMAHKVSDAKFKPK